MFSDNKILRNLVEADSDYKRLLDVDTEVSVSEKKIKITGNGYGMSEECMAIVM